MLYTKEFVVFLPFLHLQSIGISAAPKFQPATSSAHSTPVKSINLVHATSSIVVRGSGTLDGEDSENIRDSNVSKVSMSVMDLGGGEGEVNAAWDTDDDLDFDG